jgi:hypothetical protein
LSADSGYHPDTFSKGPGKNPEEWDISTQQKHKKCKIKYINLQKITTMYKYVQSRPVCQTEIVVPAVISRGNEIESEPVVAEFSCR